jgi:hypothetical protein
MDGIDRQLKTKNVKENFVLAIIVSSFKAPQASATPYARIGRRTAAAGGGNTHWG